VIDGFLLRLEGVLFDGVDDEWEEFETGIDLKRVELDGCLGAILLLGLAAGGLQLLPILAVQRLGEV
jgi:hypothetical protein